MNNEEDQRIDELEIFNYMNTSYNLTETNSHNLNVKSQLKHQIQKSRNKRFGLDLW